jgi:hypothetical protein
MQAADAIVISTQRHSAAVLSGISPRPASDLFSNGSSDTRLVGSLLERVAVGAVDHDAAGNTDLACKLKRG